MYVYSNFPGVYFRYVCMYDKLYYIFIFFRISTTYKMIMIKISNFTVFINKYFLNENMAKFVCNIFFLVFK